MEEERMERIKRILGEADHILLGIGEAMSVLPKGNSDTSVYQSILKLEKSNDRSANIMEAYHTLYELVKDRSYFVVTMNTDDLIYESGFAREQIVAPCGSVHMLQCRQHILEPFETEPVYEQLRIHLKSGGTAEDEEGRRILSCPVCGGLLRPNTAETDGYLEDAYLPQWKVYTNWLGRTLNRKLCVLELGVSFAHPSVIRFPFEKTVFYNKKAMLVRVNERFCQIPEEIKEKGIAVQADAAEFVLELKED